MKKLLLTGSTGLLGTNLLKKLPIGIMATFWEKNEPLPNEFFDYIIHAAGYGQPAKFMSNELATIDVNTTLTIELLKRLRGDGKFLFISTSEIYSGAKPPYTEDQIGTTSPTHPRACYIESKRCGEAICLAYRRLGYDVKIARLSLSYGGAKKGDSRVLNQFIERALTEKKIQLLDRGEAKRTYIYVEDAVKILWDILLKGREPIYNVGGISKTTIAELAHKIGKLTGAEVILGDKGLDGAPEDVSMDISKIIKEFGEREFIDLDEGLKRTIKWTKDLLI